MITNSWKTPIVASPWNFWNSLFGVWVVILSALLYLSFLLPHCCLFDHSPSFYSCCFYILSCTTYSINSLTFLKNSIFHFSMNYCLCLICVSLFSHYNVLLLCHYCWSFVLYCWLKSSDSFQTCYIIIDSNFQIVLLTIFTFSLIQFINILSQWIHNIEETSTNTKRFLKTKTKTEAKIHPSK